MQRKKILDKLYGIYGEIEYKEEYWEKKEKILLKYNQKEYQVELDIEIYDQSYIEYLLGIDEDFDVDEQTRKKTEIYCQHQKEMYQNYILTSQPMMKKIEEEVLKGYNHFRKEFSYEEFLTLARYGKEISDQVFEADTKEKILNLVELKEIMIFPTSIRILAKCLWFFDSGFLIYKSGEVLMEKAELIWDADGAGDIFDL